MPRSRIIVVAKPLGQEMKKHLASEGIVITKSSIHIPENILTNLKNVRFMTIKQLKTF